MARIMIKCPTTGKPVWTQQVSEKKAFETSRYSGNEFGPCPACKGRHTWDKKDAWLEETS